jgi:hypothetical protein
MERVRREKEGNGWYYAAVPESFEVTVAPPGVLVQLQALQVAQREKQVLLKLQTPHQPHLTAVTPFKIF